MDRLLVVRTCAASQLGRITHVFVHDCGVAGGAAGSTARVHTPAMAAVPVCSVCPGVSVCVEPGWCVQHAHCWEGAVWLEVLHRSFA